MSKIVIVYHSGYGHTKKVAEAVAETARGGTLLAIDAEGNLPEGGWEQLAAADTIVFGSPTYMGSVELAVQEVRRRLAASPGSPRHWKDKLAAGFTNSATMNGDKLSTLHYFFTLSQQHSMLWVGTGLMPSNAKAATRNDINYVGSFAGLMTATPSDASADEMVPGDIATAKAFGERIARGDGAVRRLSGASSSTDRACRAPVLVIAGSARAGSFSVKLAGPRPSQAATAPAPQVDPARPARARRCRSTTATSRAAHGVPDGARALRDALLAHDAVLLVTPEYNGFPTPLVINAFDWLSRLQAEGDAPAGLAATAGKPLALLSALRRARWAACAR